MGNDRRLSTMVTCWDQVHAACGVADDRAALADLLVRYGGAVERYLVGAVRDEEVAQELAQEFCVEFLKGAVRSADPDRGRFRDFVKGIAQHLVAGHFRKVKKNPRALPTDVPEATDSSDVGTDFAECWRQELLARTWQALADGEANGGQPYYRVLRLKADQPELSSEEMAERLSADLGRPITPPAARKALQRAREKFAELLLDDLKASLHTSDGEAIAKELIELRLYEYCRPALERQGGD